MPDLLVKSPFKEDGGHLIGNDPRKVAPEDFPAHLRGKSPAKAIRAKCLDCCGGQAGEVRKCVSIDCALWPFRMGINPFHGRRAA